MGNSVESQKYIIVIVTGLGDQPLDALKEKTPLEVATTPHLDRVSSSGRLGLVESAPVQGKWGSERVLLSLLGYDPSRVTVARGPLEASGIGIALSPHDLALRMNLVSTFNDILEDHSAGQISDSEADVLLKMLNLRLGSEKVEFHAGLGFRNLLVLRGGADLDFNTVPPHEVVQQPVRDFMPYGPDSELVVDLIVRAAAELEKHDINRVRIDLGENPANAVWFWGEGHQFELPPFDAMFPLRGAVVGAVPLIRGIARKVGMTYLDVAGATGGLDTDFSGKVDAAIQALDNYDLVVLHVGAVNEACLQGNPTAKIAAIEEVDSRVIGPVLQGLEKFPRWRMMVAAAHETSSREGSRIGSPVPVAFCGHNVEGIRNYTFTEANAARSDLYVEKGHNLMEFFLGMKKSRV